MQDAGTGPTGLQAQIDRSLCEIQRRLLEGAVVPFVGAGISYACKPPGCAESGAWESPHSRACNAGRGEGPVFGPTTSDLKTSLAKWLWAKCESSPDAAQRAAALLDLTCLHASKDTEGEFVERCKQTSLDRLAEVCRWLSDPRTVCKALRIEGFTTLVPRPAHRYIAYLVREAPSRHPAVGRGA